MRVKIREGLRLIRHEQSFTTKGPITYRLTLGDPTYMRILNSRGTDWVTRDEYLDVKVKIDEVGAERRRIALEHATNEGRGIVLELDHDTLKHFLSDAREVLSL